MQQATLRLLLEVGYTRLTMAEVARVAQVSRGALTHHFANKEDLVVRSISYQLDQVTQSLGRFAATAGLDRSGGGRDGRSSLGDDVGWAVLHHDGIPARGAAQPILPERLIPVVERFHDALDLVWTQLAQTSGLTPKRAKVTLNATMCLIRGMVAQSVLRDEPGYFSEILSYWKQHLRTEIAGVAREAAPTKACPHQGTVHLDQYST